MASVRDLSERADFRLGALSISPARRLIHGPDGAEHLEPLAMQVLILLVDAHALVVTRNQLFDDVWGGAAVGDDSLNRAIAQVRRAMNAVASGRFEIETIPRTGYRLTVEGVADPTMVAGPIDRRTLVAGFAAVGVLSGSAWLLSRNPNAAEASEMKERGHQVLRSSMPSDGGKAVAFLEGATRLAPEDAESWGLLALAYRNRVENGTVETVTAAMRASERAAKEALSRDRNEGNALTALATLAPEYGDWLRTEKALRDVLSRAPDNVPAINALTLLMQGLGRCTESFALNERALMLDPRDATPQYRLALKNWIFGYPERSDQVLTRALELWPHHPGMWNARLMIFAYTGRAEEGRAFLRDKPKPPGRRETSIYLWELTLNAIDSNDPKVRDIARRKLVEAGAKSFGATVHVVMTLSAMNFLDDAFTVAQGYFGLHGDYAASSKNSAGEILINDGGRKRTMMLFTPPTHAMRLDPRFANLMRESGISDYWQQSGRKPDAFLFV